MNNHWKNLGEASACSHSVTSKKKSFARREKKRTVTCVVGVQLKVPTAFMFGFFLKNVKMEEFSTVIHWICCCCILCQTACLGFKKNKKGHVQEIYIVHRIMLKEINNFGLQKLFENIY